MRRRLLSSTLVVAVIAVLLLGLPLGIVVSRLITDESRQALQEQAYTLVTEVEYRLSSGQPPAPAQIGRAYPGRYVEITMPDHSTLTAGTLIQPDRGLSARAASPSVTVKVTMDLKDVRDDVLRALLLIGALGVLAIAVAVGLATVQARRLTVPMRDLARTAERLGSGDARPRRVRYGIRELDRVAEVLDDSAVKIADLLASEREFASDASHQLRTPLTGLTMRLEEIVAAADLPDVVREEGEAAIVQAERLTAVIDELLATARHQRSVRAQEMAVDDVIDQQIVEWDPSFRHAGRRLLLKGERGLRAMATPGGLAQVLASLIENALTHGDGTVTVTTSRGGGSVTIEVADEGPGVPSELGQRIFERNVTSGKGTGLGLTLARGLAAADGGRLELVRRTPAAFAVFLRPVDRSRVVSGPA